MGSGEADNGGMQFNGSQPVGHNPFEGWMTLSRGHVTPSENTNIHIMIQSSSKSTVMKQQWGSLQHEKLY